MLRRPLCLVCLLFMVLLLAAGWVGIPPEWGNPLPEEIKTALQNAGEVRVCGEVESSQDTDDQRTLILKDTFLLVQSTKIPIKRIEVSLTENIPVPCGAVLLLSGNIREIEGPRNPGEFDRKTYYSARQIWYTLQDAQILEASGDYDAVRQGLADFREELFSGLCLAAGEDAPVFAAIVLGDRSGVDEETSLLYRMSGIMHLFALSGLHISILGMGFYNVLMAAGAGLYASSFASLCVAIPYAVMTGSSVSAMRAVTMFLLAMLGKILGRVYDSLTALAVAAILMLMESPACLYDSGFLLSFAAVLGVSLAGPAMISVFRGAARNKEPAKKRSPFKRVEPGKLLLSSLGVQAATLPLTLWFYGEVSLMGIFLNLLILPTAGIVLVSAALTAVLGCVGVNLPGSAAVIVITAAKGTALPGRLFLHLYEVLSQAAAELPFCTWIAGRPAMWQCILYYFLLALFVALAGILRKREEEREALRWKHRSAREKGEVMGWKRASLIKRAGLVFLLTAAVLILSVRQHPYCTVTCLDVGQGEGIVIRAPEGGCCLVDGGSSSKRNTGKYQLLPYLKNQGIFYVNAVFVSHTDLDHISGLQYLFELIAAHRTMIRVGELILPEWTDPPEAWTELKRMAETAGVRVRTAKQGDIFASGSLHFRILAPESGSQGENPNEDGLVVEMEYGDFQALFPGDIGSETEKKLVQEGVIEDVEMLVVPHHGSRYSSSDSFLKVAGAELAVISCSEKNVYGHPSLEAVERLEEAGCQVEYTMKSGAVTIKTDGSRIWIRRFLDES